MSFRFTRRPVGPIVGVVPDHRGGPRMRRRAALVVAAAPVLLALVPSGVAAAEDAGRSEYTVYTETNSPAGNSIIALQERNGALQQVASYAAGGAGTGAGLGSQGAVVAAGGFLFAVDAGSNQLSVFRIGEHGMLHRTDVIGTGGTVPVSVTVHRDAVYVVNAGDRSVTGFRLRGGQLSPLGVHQALPGAGAAQISFDRTGSRLIVTEKATNSIDILPVTDGIAGAAASNPSTGRTPFGFAIDRRNHVIVSNAAGGAVGASTLTSYGLAGPSGVAVISAAVPDTQSAACWVQLSGNGRFAFTTNTGSGTISSYTLAPDGSLQLLQAVAASPGAGPIDMARAGRVLFTLNAGAHTVAADLIASDGGLSAAGAATVPTGVIGLAVAGADPED